MPVFKSIDEAKSKLESMRSELRELDMQIRLSDGKPSRKLAASHKKLKKEYETLGRQLRNL